MKLLALLALCLWLNGLWAGIAMINDQLPKETQLLRFLVCYFISTVTIFGLWSLLAWIGDKK